MLNPEEVHMQPQPLWMVFWDSFEGRYLYEPVLGWIGETAQLLRPFTHVRGAIVVPGAVQSVHLREDDAIKAAKYWSGN